MAREPTEGGGGGGPRTLPLSASSVAGRSLAAKGRLPSEEEVLEKRAFGSKTLDLGGQDRRLIAFGYDVHYEPTPGAPFEDIDLTPVQEGTDWLVDKAPYILRVNGTRPLFTITSRLGGAVTMELVDIGGADPTATTVIQEVGNFTMFTWPDLATDFDAVLMVNPVMVKSEVVLRTASAPRNFVWRVIEDGHALDETRNTSTDADNRKLEVTTVRNGARLEQTWTGRVQERRRQRIPVWVETPNYPVRIR